MYYKMQLITAIYCLNLFHSLLDQPLNAVSIWGISITCVVHIQLHLD